MIRTALTLLFTAAASLAQTAAPYVIATHAGTYAPGDGGPATSGLLISPKGLTFDNAGNLYVSEDKGYRIRSISPAGTITTVAGSGTSGLPSEGARGSAASVSQVEALAADVNGNIYFAQNNHWRVYRLSPQGIIARVAGVGCCTNPGAGDGGPALSAVIGWVSGIAVDKTGNVYLSAEHRVRKIDTKGIITLVAGTGNAGFSGDGGAASAARLNGPQGLAFDDAGNLYIADMYNHRIRKVTPDGTISTYAGGGTNAEGAGTDVELRGPIGLATDGMGNLLVSEVWGQRVLKIRKAVSGMAIISTIAGQMAAAGFSGDGAPATGARFNAPEEIAVDRFGNIYVADTGNHRVRKIDTAGIITTVAGANHLAGDAGPASSALLLFPQAVAADRLANIYVADTGNYRIRKITPAGVVSTVAGSTSPQGRPDGNTTGTQPALASQFGACNGLAVDVQGNLYFSDATNNRIRKVTSTGTHVVIAGNGAHGSGADGMGTTVAITPRGGIAVDALGSVYFTESDKVRKLAPDGSLSTLAGTGTPGYLGDGGLATAARLRAPTGLALDEKGTLYIADTGNHCIRHVGLDGIISSYAGTCGAAGFAGDGAAALAARFSAPSGLSMDDHGTLYVMDSGNARVRSITKEGVVRTLAGKGVVGFSGDGGIATEAMLGGPFSPTMGVAVIGETVYFADYANHRVRKLVPNTPASLSIDAGDGQSGLVGTALSVPLTVRIIGSAGLPIQGAAVSFAVTSGTATLSARSATTNNDGRAAVRLTLGETTGPITVVASTNTLSPVTFKLTALPKVASQPMPRYRVRTIAGAFTPGNDGPATQAILLNPNHLLADALGNVYIADTGNFMVRKVAPDGTITSIAGNGVRGTAGDGGPATAAQLTAPMALALDTSGRLYIGDGARVRRVDTDGSIATIAGSTTSGFGGDGGPAQAATFSSVVALLCEPSGGLLIADNANHRIRRIAADGVITTVVGTGEAGYAGDGGPATQANIAVPSGLARDSAGNLFIAEGNQIRRVAPDGTIATLAGTGVAAYSGDGGPATDAALNGPYTVALDASGNLWISDSGNNRVRMVNQAGVIATLAGNGEDGTSEDGVSAIDARISTPLGIAVDAAGNVLFAEANTVRALRPDGTTGTYAGRIPPSGDDGPAADALILSPTSIARDRAGNLFVTDVAGHRIRKVDSGGTITTIAGTGFAGYSGDDGPGASAQIRNPWGIGVDSLGAVIFADSGNQRVRTVDAGGGRITTLAGNGARGYSGDKSRADAAALNQPYGIAIAPDGTVYFADRKNHRIRKITPDNTISTVAGTGTGGFSGDGGTATTARLRNPTAVALDGSGNLFIADAGNYRIRKLSLGDGRITTIAGNGINDYGTERVHATSTALGLIFGIAADGAGNVYFTEGNRIRRIAADGIIETLAGSDSWGYAGDDDVATNAIFAAPRGLCLDSVGTLYVADTGNHRVRQLAVILEK